MKYSLGHAKWIWTADGAAPDEYGEFYSEFDYRGGNARLSISADSNYAVYINGGLASFGQYADFPYDKVYDEIDITDKCRPGKNSLAVVVWYYGIGTTQVYIPGKAALMFSLDEDGEELIFSSEKTLSRLSRTYANHREKRLTAQMGLSFAYDGTREEPWMTGCLSGFSESTPVMQSLPLRPRPCKKLTLGKTVVARLLKRLDEHHALYDLGINCVGFIGIKTASAKPMPITVAYGEHIADGRVRRIIGDRDFSVEITAPEGEFSYMNPFRRLGCKYLEVECDNPEDIEELTLTEVLYPVNILPKPKGLDEIEEKIYDACIRTLTLCMHEHYEDCPWREQALYTMDSRNQMLTGYYAFGEYEFARASLELISKDRREDGLLSICYPISRDLVIPSFSLHYFTECREYMEYSSDTAFIKEIFPKLKSIISVFEDRSREGGGIISPYRRGGCQWNFYEWREGLDGRADLDSLGRGGYSSDPEPDIIINTLYILALRSMAKMALAVGEPDEYSAEAQRLALASREYFFDGERGLFADRREVRTYSQLGNSLAVLAGLPRSEEEARSVCELLVSDKEITEITLSMRCFFIDALLLVDKERYTPFILSEIKRIYAPMLDYGVGTVWETELGEADFGGAGSLCHGWSALPVYYYHILKK